MIFIRYTQIQTVDTSLHENKEKKDDLLICELE
jgi:hypothetical protein